MLLAPRLRAAAVDHRSARRSTRCSACGRRAPPTGSAPTSSAATYGRRTVYGTRVSLIVGLAVAVLSISIGLVVGMLAGYIRLLDAHRDAGDGRPDGDPRRAAGDRAGLALGREPLTVIVAITVPEIPRVVRLVRAVVLTVREEPYVEAAIAAGTRLPLILIRHVLPNCVPAADRAGDLCVRLRDADRGDPVASSAPARRPRSRAGAT